MRVLLIIRSLDEIQRVDFLLRYGNFLNYDINNIIDLKYILYDHFFNYKLLPNDIVINYRIYDIKMKNISNKCKVNNVICGLDVDNQYFINNQNLYNDSLIKFINDQIDFCIVDSKFLELHKCINKINLPTFKLDFLLLENVKKFSENDSFKENKKNSEELKVSFININNITHFSERVFRESIYLYELFRKWSHFTLDLYSYKENISEALIRDISFLPFRVNIFFINENIFDLLKKYKYTYIYTDKNLEKNFYYSIIDCCKIAKTNIILQDRNNMIKFKNDISPNSFCNELNIERLFILEPNLEISMKQNLQIINLYSKNMNDFLVSINKNCNTKNFEKYVNIFSIRNYHSYSKNIPENTLLINFDLSADFKKFDLSFLIHESKIYLKMSLKFLDLFKKLNPNLYMSIGKYILKEKSNYSKLKFELLESFIDFSVKDFYFISSSLYLNDIYNELNNSLKMKQLINKFFISLFINVNLYYLKEVK